MFVGVETLIYGPFFYIFIFTLFYTCSNYLERE